MKREDTEVQTRCFKDMKRKVYRKSDKRGVKREKHFGGEENRNKENETQRDVDCRDILRD